MRSISRLNLASLTGNPPSSLITDPGSAPTSSMKTRPNNSRDNRHRPVHKQIKLSIYFFPCITLMEDVNNDMSFDPYAIARSVLIQNECPNCVRGTRFYQFIITFGRTSCKATLSNYIPQPVNSGEQRFTQGS